MARLSKEEQKHRHNIELQVERNKRYKEKYKLKQVKIEIVEEKYNAFDKKLAEQGITKKQFLEDAIDKFLKAEHKIKPQ